MNKINETERRFPRTLAEAYPSDYPEQFIAIQKYQPRRVDPDWMIYGCCLFALGFFLGVCVGRFGGY